MNRARIPFALAVAALAACAHESAKVAVAAPPPPALPETLPPPAMPLPAPPAAPVRVACSADDQCGTTQLCLQSACTEITPAMDACGVTRVHFDFDNDVLHPAEYPQLRRMARCLGAEHAMHLLITGNADERGTVAYNLALGRRRAGAVRKYLGDLGIGDERLQLVTYGKELPLCTEHAEACWAENRRAALRPDEKPFDLRAEERRDEAVEHARMAGK